jgi:hypothetical protein
MNVLNLIGQIFKPAMDMIDNVHTSEEEKLEKKAVLLELQTQFLTDALNYEQEQLKAKASIIIAEAKSESWLARSWRPVTMLSFVVLIGAFWFGLTPETVTQESIDAMFLLVQIGLGGYVVGRSAEKTAGAVATALKKKEST